MDFLLELFIVLQILQTIFVQNFNCKFELILLAVSSENKECLLTGDMNCNYLNFSGSQRPQINSRIFWFETANYYPMRITQALQSLTDIICSNVPQNIILFCEGYLSWFERS